eukprot:363651-Chlamydomonas_euryale.AAC.3
MPQRGLLLCRFACDCCCCCHGGVCCFPGSPPDGRHGVGSAAAAPRSVLGRRGTRYGCQKKPFLCCPRAVCGGRDKDAVWLQTVERRTQPARHERCLTADCRKQQSILRDIGAVCRLSQTRTQPVVLHVGHHPWWSPACIGRWLVKLPAFALVAAAAWAGLSSLGAA